ncbi:MAG TPA: hypothetical protein PLU64_16800, partial [Saprospiraceae bacterium]|nr:hypothetical protein [Saprospiraceae bacterium]
ITAQTLVGRTAQGSEAQPDEIIVRFFVNSPGGALFLTLAFQIRLRKAGWCKEPRAPGLLGVS